MSALALVSAMTSGADVVAHYDMTVNNGCITESVSGLTFAVDGNFAPENVDGARGKALRFDGYTSRINATFPAAGLTAGAKTMSVSCWVALPCYPIIQIDTNTTEETAIVSCLDTEAKTGWGFFVGFDGRYSFRTFVNGWPANLEVSAPLPVNQWNYLVATVDCDSRSIKLYNNGVEVASGKANGSISLSADAPLYMGQSTVSRKSGPFELMSFNGLVDDVTVYNSVAGNDVISACNPDNAANLDIPASRFADDLLRPRFHGMPAAGWTNECHGMTYAAGRYHLFFQKNGDGPYMARLHWGHISSENLYDWREEPIALAPGAPYDIKGCWSGCVFTDEVITGGKPNIIYTAVDYAKASIAQAMPLDESLIQWQKSAANPIIARRPTGLSDDFRDPYFFRSGSDAYIIVGSSKGGVGTTTLHKYNPASGSWSNTGQLFFSGTSASTDGTFWEMPNITLMSDGRWLFTATPLGSNRGVRTIYYTGSINADGTFAPDARSTMPRQVELNSREGFGLLSPTVYNHDGRTIVLGIVPDKLSAQNNWNLGWAHCYSLPRLWTLDANGDLSQRPVDGLEGLRTATVFSESQLVLNGSRSMAPVSGRAFEIDARVEVGSNRFGFNFFKNGSAQATLTYDPAAGQITLDFSRLTRLVNDDGVYNGIYTCTLPERPAAGTTLKINMFVDHSIIDLFVNDRWATSIRVFPTDPEANDIEVFADGNTNFIDLKAWTLAVDGSDGVESLPADSDADIPGTIYRLDGTKVAASDTDTLAPGLYITAGRKLLIR